MNPLARLAALLATVAASAAIAASAAGGAPPITREELSQRIAEGRAPLILDVRTAQEFADGHLSGARNIPHDQLAGRLAELAIGRRDEVVVHCHSGRRAAAAEQMLRDAGYTNVRDLEGHWQEWREAGLPAE